MSRSTCAACKASKEDDWIVCTDCQMRAARHLREIPKLHAFLLNDASLKLPERTDLERKSKGPSRGAPANLHAIALVDSRTDVRSVLAPWLEDLFDRMKITGKPPVDVGPMCQRLTDLLPWCASRHEACADLIHEVRHQFVSLDRVVNGSRRPPAPVPCPVVLPDSGDCVGHLILHRDGTVTCPVCESAWPFEDWQRLGSLLA